MDREFRGSTQRDLGRWKAALVPEPRSEPGVLTRSLVLAGTFNDGVLGVERPGDVWIEALQDDTPLPIRWQPIHTRPGVVIEVEVQGAKETEPAIQIWVSDRRAAPVGTLSRDRDFVKLGDLAPATWSVSSGEIGLDSALIETHSVPTRDGSMQRQPCLVLRGRCPQGTRYRLRTDGLEAEGQDEQFFSELGQFTFRQWPVTEADVKRSLKQVQLISVEQFQLDTEQTGGNTMFPPASLQSDGPRETASAAGRERATR